MYERRDKGFKVLLQSKLPTQGIECDASLTYTLHKIFITEISYFIEQQMHGERAQCCMEEMQAQVALSEARMLPHL